MFTSKSTVANLSKRSAAIKDVFTKTVEDCKAVNEEIEVLVDAKNVEIANLQNEVSVLNGISNGNSKLATKIESFLKE